MNTFWKDLTESTFIWHGYGAKGQRMLSDMPNYQPATVRATSEAYVRMLQQAYGARTRSSGGH